MSSPIVELSADLIQKLYSNMQKQLGVIRRRLKRPLTLSEKILFTHLINPEQQPLEPGKAYLQLLVDRVIMQDATAQMAILQFMQSGRATVAVPSSVHCDHLIQAYEGAAADTRRAVIENLEVYEYLRSACAKYGIGFWRPGSGIIHQVVLENYSFPGGVLIGSDSHTPNMGGMGMIAIGVGGADTVDAMAGIAWEVLQPKIIGIRLTGELAGWASPKDIILYVAGKLTVKGGTNRILEYFGPGAATLSTTGKATITNMGAEIGATTSIFAYDQNADTYLRATDRGEIADLAKSYFELFTSDLEVEENPNFYYDQVIEINLSNLEPHIVGPFTPDLARPVSQLKSDVEKFLYPEKISSVLIGSCTNSSYQDISRAASVAEQALRYNAKAVVPFMVTPGSNQVFETLKRDGKIDPLVNVGAQVMANACGPCIGQWRRDDVPKRQPNTIVNSYNRNFPGRNDDNPETYAFVASPEVATAFALAGNLKLNPLQDELTAQDGTKYRLEPPPKAVAVPDLGFIGNKVGYEAPSLNPEEIEIKIPEHSGRLQILEPFEPLVEPEFANMPVLMKTMGKTTTDHISPAGRWLKYRGHLDKISDNLLLGAMNAWTGERGLTSDAVTGEKHLSVADVARRYKAAKKRWIIVGDENYGEGSSREHAAMTPRWLGAAAVVARSFARIHESNLKKQGILPFTFADPHDYEKILEGDLVNLEYMHELDPVRTVNMLVKHMDGSFDVVKLCHTLNMEHLAWFHAGSALNLIRKQQGQIQDPNLPHA